jgi:hypothetical protein
MVAFKMIMIHIFAQRSAEHRDAIGISFECNTMRTRSNGVTAAVAE